MKLSTKGRYGLRAILDLALHQEEGATSISTISERTGISVNYLEQLIAKLRKAELVISIRGAQGGYQLVKTPEAYSVGMILRLTEGCLAPVECLAEGALPCDRHGQCATVELYKRIYDALNQVVDNMSLQDLLDIEAKKAASDFVI